MPDPQDRPDSEPSDASTPPAKKLPAKKAAKKAPARKTPAKKAPAKKHPPRVLSPRHQSLPRRPSVCSSGSKPTASLQLLLRMQRHEAKSTVEGANDALARNASVPAPSHSPVPLIVAVTLSLLALLLIRQLRRR